MTLCTGLNAYLSLGGEILDRIAIIYVSLHHHNTKKVIEEMAEQRALDIIKLSEAPEIDWS